MAENFAKWASELTGMSETAVKRYAFVGENLDPDAADQLRGTEFENRFSELDALCRLEPAMQRAVARLLADSESGVPSVLAALAILEGTPRTPPDPVLKSAIRYERWSRAERRNFLYALSDEAVDEIVELCRARKAEARR